MMSTMMFIAIFIGLLLTSLLLWAFFLRLGLSWVQATETTTRRVILTSAVVIFIQNPCHVTSASEIDKTVRPGDRFMVSKCLTPQRWDLVVFQYPEDPKKLFVKRLVGLPGETIHIDDGSIWVNGSRQTLPDSIKEIDYLSEFPKWMGMEMWGTEKRPAQLGDDEYFVLGDFSALSMDSRFWRTGATGHNPYAVPQSHIKGVVINTFWPIHRWRVHQ